MEASAGQRGRSWRCDCKVLCIPIRGRDTLGQSEIARAATGAMVMDSIRLKNYRCFRDEWDVPLTPLTLLVGENGAGKTSFMAMMRILSDISASSATPDFNLELCDLGSFDEIAYRDKSYQAKTFDAGFDATLPASSLDNSEAIRYKVRVTFGKRGTAPVPVRRYFSLGDASVEYLEDAVKTRESAIASSDTSPFYAAPIRAYCSEPLTADAKYNHIPQYLSELSAQNGEKWETVKSNLEKFGYESGLFDEINVKNLDDARSAPYQIQVRKSDNGHETPFHNLLDVGGGVSQALPVVVQTVRDVHCSDAESPKLFLLQQPETRLHPRAQAALGSLFCRLANRRNQFIIETHSDYLMDRVRMDARDGIGNLKPEDVSFLYFERSGSQVKIYSLGVDDNGNVTRAPNSYRRFFMEETKRDIGL